MLIKRIITAIILIPLALLAIFYLPALSFALVFAFILALAGWEWAKLMGLVGFWRCLSYIIILLCLFALCIFIPMVTMLIVGIVWWLAAFYFVLRYESFSRVWARGYIMRGLIGILIFVPCWVALSIIRVSEHGSIMILLLLLIIWASDTGAYFIGRWVGKHKLAPKVSPGKTIEGFCGGVVSAFIVIIIAGILLKFGAREWIGFLVLTLITSFVSVLGDLFESRVKRECGVKDSGNILPGHGGILDRLDSLLSAAPFFATGLLLIVGIQ